METESIEQASGTTILPIEDFARQQGISKRKVNRYVKLGRLQSQKINGKKFIVNLSPKESPQTIIQQEAAEQTEDVQNDPLEQMNRVHWMQLGTMQAQARSKTRWQNYAFVMTIGFAAVSTAALWFFIDSRFSNSARQSLTSDKYTLAKQLSSVNIKADGFGLQVETLRNQVNQLTVENAALKAQNDLYGSQLKTASNNTAGAVVIAKPAGAKPVAATQQVAVASYAKIAEPVTTQTVETVAAIDSQRQSSILSGNFPNDMTRQELLAAFGEPDRTYKAKGYEQWVYFGRSPCRFWFRGTSFVNCTE